MLNGSGSSARCFLQDRTMTRRHLLATKFELNVFSNSICEVGRGFDELQMLFRFSTSFYTRIDKPLGLRESLIFSHNLNLQTEKFTVEI